MKKLFLSILALGSTALLAASAHAANVTWSGGAGTWQNAAQGGFDATYNNGDDVTFSMSGTPSDRNIALVGVLAPANLTVTNPVATTLPLTNGFDFIADASGKSIAATGNLTLNSASVAFQNTAGSGAFTMANTVGGNLLYNGGNVLALPGAAATRNVTLTVTGNLAAATAGNTLLFSTEGSTVGTLTISGTKPSVTNGMTSAGIQYGVPTTNVTADFATFSGNNLASASGSYTSYAAAADWSGATSTEIVNLTGATTLSGSGTKNIYALRASSGNQNLGGRTVALGSGGLITTNLTISNGTLDFGSGPGFIGAYNAASQGTISASLAGSGGITVMGNSQSLKLSSTTNSFTNGLYVNNGRVSLDVAAAANNNDVTVSSFGELTSSVEGSTAPAVIGGLSGTGAVKANFQGNNTKNYYLRISPASGSYTFDGTIANGAAGALLHISKNGSGTQVFGTNSTGTYTGTTTVNAGTLLLNGTFSGTGAITVKNTATLGRTGSTAISLGGDLTFDDGAKITLSLGASGAHSTLTRTGGTWAFDATSQAFTFDNIAAAVGNYTGLITGLAGTETGLSDIANWSITNSDWVGTFSYNSGSVDLNLTTVPEPATWGLLAFSLTTTLVLRRRRNS